MYWPSPWAPEKLWPWIVAETSIISPFSAVRCPPIVSKPSSESPIGSLRVWHEAQTLLLACAINRSRRVLREIFASLTTEKSTSFGGSGVGEQRKMSCSATPRFVGEERPG